MMMMMTTKIWRRVISSAHVSVLWVALVRIDLVDWKESVCATALTAVVMVTVISDFHFAVVIDLLLVLLVVVVADVVYAVTVSDLQLEQQL